MKKIIALAVASAFVAPLALAEVTIYGSMRPTVEYTRVSDAGASNINKVQLIDNSSRIGFRGTDKLDSGIKLFWQVENRVRIGTKGNATSTTDGFSSRDSFVGLQGKFGTVQAGKISTLNDDFNSGNGYAPALVSWNTASADMRNFIIRDTARIANVAQYISPTIAGVRTRLQYDFGYKTSSSVNARGYEAELGYTHKLFRFGGIYKNAQDTTFNGDGSYATDATIADGADYQKYILGGSFTPMAGLEISAEWTRQKTRLSASASVLEQDVYGVGAMYSVGKHSTGLQYAKAKDSKSAGVSNANTGADAFALQYKYALSKQTNLLAIASYVNNDANAKLKMTGSVSAVNGMTVSALSAGLRHDF